MPLPTFVTHLFSTVKNQLLETDSSKVFNDQATDEILFKLYNKVALYYDDPARNFTNEYLSALYEQLDILFEKLSEWGAKHALPTLVLDTFLKRLKTEKKGKLQEVFFNRGKRLLERLVVSLAKEEIPLEHKKRVLSTLLANDGLEQCVDNCQLMFEHAVNSLDHLSNMKLFFSGLVSDYVTQLTIDVASSEDILLPQSFQRILCSLNHLPYAAYEEIAKNYFLLYAKEAGFPINVLQDVNALRLQSQLDRKQLNYEQLHQDFLDMLKNRFQLGELIDHVSMNYYKKINKILSNDYPYQYKLDLIVALLNLIGQDNDFTLHHILNEKGLLDAISGVKLAVIKRFIQHNYLPEPSQYVVKVSDQDYSLHWFPTEFALNWIAWNQGDEDRQIFFSDLLIDFKNFSPLTTDNRDKISLSFAKANPALLNDRIAWLMYANQFYATNEASLNSEIERFFLLFMAETETGLFATELEKLPQEKVNFLIKQTTAEKRKQFLKKILLRIDFSRRYTSIEGWSQSTDTLEALMRENVSSGYLKRVRMLTAYIQQFIEKGADFSGLIFPSIPALNYLDNLNFESVNLQNVKFYQAIGNVVFQQSSLRGARFLSSLQQVSFVDCDLSRTYFMPGEKNYHAITLLNSPSDLVASYGLQRAGVAIESHFFSSFNLSYEQFNQLLNVFDWQVEWFLSQLPHSEIDMLLKKIDEWEEWELWQWMKPYLQERLLARFLQLEFSVFDKEKSDFQANFDGLVEGFIGLTLTDSIYPLLLSRRMNCATFALDSFNKITLNCFLSRHKKRSTASHCLAIDEVDRESFSQLNHREHQALNFLLAESEEADVATVLRSFSMLDSLKKKSVLYRSERELQFLADFSQIVDQLLQSHDSYLISTSNPRQSTLASIELEGYAPVYLRLYSTSDTRINYIYCSTLDAAHVLAIEDGLESSEHLLNQYAALLFPNHSIVSVRFRFYKRLSESKPFKSIFQKIVTMDFSSDRVLLKQNQDRISVFPLKVFCRLFLINGQAPVIDQLHADIFSDKASKLSLSENFFEIFAFLSVTQRLQLAKLVKTYQIPLVSSVKKQDLGATLRFELNQRIYHALESSVALNEGLMDKQLTELGSQVWRSSLLNKFPAEKTEIIVTTLNEACQRFTQHPGNVLSQTLRPLVFFTPALIQLFNGDPTNFEFLSTSMVADIAFNKALAKLMRNDYFMRRFPEISHFLGVQSNYFASPIGKGLVIYSLLELKKDLANYDLSSAEYKITKSLLLDNEIMLGMLVLEMAGVSLGPLGLLIDVEITVHQLFALSSYWQTKLPFRVSRFSGLALSLGFYQAWMKEQAEQLVIAQGQTLEIERLETLTGLTFSYQLFRIAEVENVKTLLTPAVYATGTLGTAIKISDAKIKEQYILRNSSLDVEFTPIREVRLENTLINREKLNALYPHWKVVATRKTEAGDWFSASPISINQGQGLLLERKNRTEQASPTLITSFNPCLGPVTLRGGEFLKGKQLYLLVQSLGLAVLPPEVAEDSCIASSLNFTEIKPYANEMIVFVGENKHSADIAIVVDAITFIMLPIISRHVRHSAEFTHVSMLNATLALTSKTGDVSTRFTQLENKKTIVLLFIFDVKPDYCLGGVINFPKIKTIHLGAVHSCDQDPPYFVVPLKQNFFVTVNAGKSSYAVYDPLLNTMTPVFFLVYRGTRKNEAPEVIKQPEGKFAVRFKQPINQMRIHRNESNHQFTLSLQRGGMHLTLQTLTENQALSVEGFYRSSEAVQVACVYTIANRVVNLELKDVKVAELKVLLEDINFSTLLSLQGLAHVLIRESSGEVSAWLSYDANELFYHYRGLTYLSYPPFGLVAKNGVISKGEKDITGNESLIEDFSASLTSIVDVISEYHLPLRYRDNRHVVYLADRALKLPLSARLLINSGSIVPLDYLPRCYSLTRFTFRPDNKTLLTHQRTFIETHSDASLIRHARAVIPIREKHHKKKELKTRIHKRVGDIGVANSSDNTSKSLFFRLNCTATDTKPSIANKTQGVTDFTAEGVTSLFSFFSIVLSLKKKMKLPCSRIKPSVTASEVSALTIEIYSTIEDRVAIAAKKLKLASYLRETDVFKFNFCQKLSSLLASGEPIELIALIQEEIESSSLTSGQKKVLGNEIIPFLKQLEHDFNASIIRRLHCIS